MHELTFTFEGRSCRCQVYLDRSEMPFYLFVILLDADLILRFGEEITVKTDLHALLPRADDRASLVALRKGILEAYLAAVGEAPRGEGRALSS